MSVSSFQLLPQLLSQRNYSLIARKTSWTTNDNSVVRRRMEANVSCSQLWMSTSSTSRLNFSKRSNIITVKEDQDEDDTADDDKLTILIEEHRIWSKALDDVINRIKKKRKSLQSELTKADLAESTVARAQLLVSNLYMFKDGVKSAIVIDWEDNGKEVELKLDTTRYESASAEADALFSLVRKLKRGSIIVADLLEKTDTAWEILNEVESDLKSVLDQQGGIDEGRLALVKERLIRTEKSTKFQVPAVVGITTSYSSRSTNSKKEGQNSTKNRRERKPDLGTPASNVRKIKSPAGCTILIGRNRRGNEYLSLSVARDNDIWMHSRNCPGAHILIQNRRGSNTTVTDECLQFGADLAIFYSDLRNENKAEVTAAEPKHIQKPRGSPLGAVKLREEWKTFVGRPNNVPDELKEARQESGQTDEYHLYDKAKHRQRTKQVVEEDRAKRRQQQRGRKSRK